MRRSFILRIMAGALTAAALFTGCGSKKADIPYTDLGFDATLQDIIDKEGENYDSYDSVYYGTTYTYDKEYKGRTGMIKYMLDDSEALMNVAWSYSAGSGDEADALYKEIYSDISEKYGEPSDNKGVNNYNAIWKREEGNIVLSALVSSEANAVQIAFLNPLVSRDEDGNLPEGSPLAENKNNDGDGDLGDDFTLNVTIEDIKAANSYEALLKNHKTVVYEAKQYANKDVDNGYLGYDNTVLEKDGEDIVYKSSAASQSVPFTVIVEKNDKGKYVQKTQFAGESIVETEYESEEAMKEDMKRLWYFDSDDFMNEEITEISTQDGAVVVATERTPDDGEYASDTITRYYFLDSENHEILGINEIMPTDTDYGEVMTVTTITYDEEPDFTIGFTEVSDESASEEDYSAMGNAEDGEE